MAPNAIAQLMMDCWKQEPSERPTFVQLERRLSELLETPIIEHYIKLNEPYIQMNLSDKSPYLLMVSQSKSSAGRVEDGYVNTALQSDLWIKLCASKFFILKNLIVVLLFCFINKLFLIWS